MSHGNSEATEASSDSLGTEKLQSKSSGKLDKSLFISLRYIQRFQSKILSERGLKELR
jgi:hypothetical protein